ncbi:cysteine proteinase [Ramicandelaber brevisporus]|nr:cysteine proteinase [Ramicandelaber brevisporus]
MFTNFEPIPRSATVTTRSVVLYANDVELLQPGCWFNDAVLVFFLELLEETTNALFASAAERESHLLFLQPAVVHLLTQLGASDPHGTAAAGIAPAALSHSRVVFLPVNDSDDMGTNSETGSHWSLLVYLRGSKTFIHYDSHRGFNAGRARRVAKVIWSIMQASNPTSGRHSFVSPSDVPQQTNLCDCGPFVAAFTKVLAEQYIRQLSMPHSGHHSSGLPSWATIHPHSMPTSEEVRSKLYADVIARLPYHSASRP